MSAKSWLLLALLLRRSTIDPGDSRRADPQLSSRLESRDGSGSLLLLERTVCDCEESNSVPPTEKVREELEWKEPSNDPESPARPIPNPSRRDLLRREDNRSDWRCLRSPACSSSAVRANSEGAEPVVKFLRRLAAEVVVTALIVSCTIEL